MKKVLILVEGQTEERFAKDILSPHLWQFDTVLVPTILTTKRVKAGRQFKGGITAYYKVEKEVSLLLGDTSATAVTTFFDYYGLPLEFPGMQARPAGPPVHRAKHVESEWAKTASHERFHPFLMVHEFEALLFARPTELSTALVDPGSAPKLLAVRKSFRTPEEINDDPNTAPSKRIVGILPGYQKPVHGPMVASRIGLPAMRAECPHFGKWLTWLEAL